MKTKQVLDVQQMRHLQELGLDTSNASALYCIDNETNEKQIMWNEQVEETDKDYEYFRIVPAYTLQDVLDALPEFIEEYCLIIDMSFGVIRYDNLTKRNNPILKETYFNDEDKYLIDAAYELLCWVIENGYISKLPANKNSR